MLDSLLFGSVGPPLVGYHFRVDFGLPGLFVKDVGFESVSGISMTLKTESVQSHGKTVEIASGVEYGDLVLSRGLIHGSKLGAWLEAQITLKRKFPIPIVISALDKNRMPVYCWTFINAYPTQLSVDGFNAVKGELLVEKVTFKYDSYKALDLSM